MPDVTIPGIKLVWDLIVGLIHGYSAQKRGLFEQHVDPLQKRMLAIHRDYQETFGQVRKHLVEGAVPPGELIEFLKERKRQYESERDLTASLAEELAKAQRRGVSDPTWSALETYCRGIVKYFEAANDIAGLSWYTDFINGVQARIRGGLLSNVWSSAGFANDPRADLVSKVDFILDRGLPGALSPINTYYAVLRAKLL